MQIDALNCTELRAAIFVRIHRSLIVNVWKHGFRECFELVISCHYGGKINCLPPGDSRVAWIICVHLQHLVGDLLQAHSCDIQAPIYTSAINTLS
jgi:hypothetical protein